MNRPIHFEIPAENPEKAMEFYRKVFGWKFATLILLYRWDALTVIVVCITITIVLFCVADVVNRMVNENVVRFTKWLHNKTLKNSRGSLIRYRH